MAAAPALVDNNYQLNIPGLQGLRLNELCSGSRFRALDKLDQYADCKQYDALTHNWDGHRLGYGDEPSVLWPGYIPLEKRRPSVRYNLGKLIIGRLTAMALGEESWPEVTVPGDEEAEDYTKALADACKLQQRMQEARNKGGGSGTAVMSFAFVNGEPRVKVHEAKHCYPMRWADRDEHVLGELLKAYRYTRTVFVDGRPVPKDFYSVRYWSQDQETVWDPVPDELARNGRWSTAVRSYTVVHGYGECPVYWVQNLPDGEREDGVSDIDGLDGDFDKVNHLLSATTKGTIANVDPTLVIHDDPGKNPGHIHKGTGHAIFSKLGAEYLELKGDSVKVAKELVQELVRYCLNTAGVVIGDPEKMGGKAQSAQALKMLYLPMCNQCDLLRVQYGQLITNVLRGMLRAARLIGQSEPGPTYTTADGIVVQQKPVVILPPKVEKVDQPDPSGEKPSVSTEVSTERSPGTLDRIELKWPPYFAPSMVDVQAMVEASTKAVGQTISRRTAIKFTAPVFGVTDVDQEQAELEVERAQQVEEQGQLMDRAAEAEARNAPAEE